MDDDRHALLLPGGGIVRRGSVTPDGSADAAERPRLRDAFRTELRAYSYLC